MIDKNDGFVVELASLLSETQIRGLHDDRRLLVDGQGCLLVLYEGRGLSNSGRGHLSSMRSWTVEVDI